MYRHTLIRTWSGIILCLLISSQYSLAQNRQDEYESNSVIIQFRSSESPGDAQTTEKRLLSELSSAVRSLTALSKSSAEIKRIIPEKQLALIEIPEGTVDDVIELFKDNPDILSISPNYRLTLYQQLPELPKIPEDLLYSWGLQKIQAQEAWSIETGSDVVVGVIDTGVDWNHEDLGDNIWINPGEIRNNNIDDDNNGYVDDIVGWDFGDNDNDPTDEDGHGTHVAGTLGARGDNGIGITGVNWAVKIVPLKIMNSSGVMSVYGAIEAINYAANMGIKISNNSWGHTDTRHNDEPLRRAIADAGIKGHLFIAAAGNDNKDNDGLKTFPASFDLDNIISVAATTPSDRLAGFSNWGRFSVDLGAPGTSIPSTWPNNQLMLRSER